MSTIIAEGKALKAMGGRFLLLGDPDYPEMLAHSATPPPVLSVLGDPSILNRQCIAIVGAQRVRLGHAAGGKHGRGAGPSGHDHRLRPGTRC